jgi:hypothetical protein
MYTEIEEETLDIDWFFTDGNHIGFVASAGGKLPRSIADLELDDDEILFSYIDSLIEDRETLISPDLNSIAQDNGFTITEKYLSYFESMSRKGFYSFNKSNNNRLQTIYHLVTKPINPLKVSDIPENIMRVLNKTYYKGDISDISLINIEEIT